MRLRLNPSDGVTAAEWRYIENRFSAADAKERREWIGTILKRLVRKGCDPARVHHAILLGIRRWETHQLMTRRTIRDRNKRIERARKDVARALDSLRQLLPGNLKITDDDLFLHRDVWLKLVPVPPTDQPKGGRPWAWRHHADDALKQAAVSAEMRRELLSAIFPP